MTDQEHQEHQAHRGYPDPGTARAEAERLVATGLAALSMAADRIGAPARERGGPAAAGFDALGDMLFGPSGHRRHSVANDSPDCCRCPVCRAISAVRDPDPRVAERLATGVGQLAETAVRVLRGVAGTVPPPPRPAEPPRPADPARATDPPGSAVAEPPDRPAGAVRRAEPPEHPDPWAAATAADAR